jgi:hypothetical protein
VHSFSLEYEERAYRGINFELDELAVYRCDGFLGINLRRVRRRPSLSSFRLPHGRRVFTSGAEEGKDID